MKTKYDWSNVPKDIQWIATDGDGWAWGWYGEPKIGRFDEWYCYKSLHGWHLKPANNPFTGHWTESLEERP